MAKEIYRYKWEDRDAGEYVEEEIVVKKFGNSIEISVSNYQEDYEEDSFYDAYAEIDLPKEEAIKLAKAILKAFGEND